MSQLHFATATELAGKIKRREISAAELLDHFLGRVEKYNPRLNAIIWMDVEGPARCPQGTGRGRLDRGPSGARSRCESHFVWLLPLGG